MIQAACVCKDQLLRILWPQGDDRMAAAPAQTRIDFVMDACIFSLGDICHLPLSGAAVFLPGCVPEAPRKNL